MTLTKTTLFSLVGLSALALVSTLYFADQKPAETPFDPATLSGVQTGTHPWPPETARLLERLEMIGLPALTIEGTRDHSHQHLEFFIRGEHYTLPSENPKILLNFPAMLCRGFSDLSGSETRFHPFLSFKGKE